MSDELRARLSEMSTEELSAILAARDGEQWRPEVFPLVEQLLAERGVESVAPAEPPEPEFHPEGSLEPVTTFHSTVEANLCRMALNEAGIEAWLSNENLAAEVPTLGIAIGVDVLVRGDQVAAARELLTALDSGAAALQEEPEACPKCQSSDTEHYHARDTASAVSGYFLLATPLPAGEWRWRCRACGHEWH